MYLLDVNILISLVDPSHVHCERSTRWFVLSRAKGWATCPLTQNAFIRILGHPNYPAESMTTEAARRLLQTLCSQPGHQFWPDSISLVNPKIFPTLPTSKNLTDLYLLGLAVQHQARFATLDRRIDPASVVGGPAALTVVA